MSALSPTASRALAWADGPLTDTPHSDLTLTFVARKGSATSNRPPSALHNAFGSLRAFHTHLAARQWQRATEALEPVDGGPLEVAMADIRFAVTNPHRFRLMYAPELWVMIDERDQPDASRRPKDTELEAFSLLERARNDHYEAFCGRMDLEPEGSKARLLAALVTGLSFEFVNERLFQGDRERQLGHAEELLGMVLG